MNYVWIIFALTAFTLFGFNRVLFIVNSRFHEANLDFLHTLYLIATLISFSIYLVEFSITKILSITSILVGISLGVLSLTGSISLNYALRNVSPVLANCIIGLNVVIPLAIAFIILKENLTGNTLLGLIISIIVIILSTLEELKHARIEHSDKLSYLAYVFITFTTWGMLSVIVKLSSIYISNFDVYLTTFTMFLTSFTGLTIIRRRFSIFSESGKIGVIAGFLSSVGTLLCMLAYVYGPLSLVALTIRLNFSIPVLYSLIYLKERVTKLKLCSLILTPFALVLMSL